MYKPNKIDPCPPDHIKINLDICCFLFEKIPAGTPIYVSKKTATAVKPEKSEATPEYIRPRKGEQCDPGYAYRREVRFCHKINYKPSIPASTIPSEQSQVEIEGAASEEVSPPSTTTPPPGSQIDPIAIPYDGNKETGPEPVMPVPQAVTGTTLDRYNATGASVRNGRSRRAAAGDSSLGLPIKSPEKATGAAAGGEEATGAADNATATEGVRATGDTTGRNETTGATRASSACDDTAPAVTIPKCSSLNFFEKALKTIASAIWIQAYECTSVPDATFNITDDMSVPCPKCYLRHELGYCYPEGLDDERDIKFNRPNGTYAKLRKAVMIALRMTAKGRNGTSDVVKATETNGTDAVEELSGIFILTDLKFESKETTTDATTEQTTTAAPTTAKATTSPRVHKNGMQTFEQQFFELQRQRENGTKPTFYRRRPFDDFFWPLYDGNSVRAKKSSRRADGSKSPEVTGNEPKSISDDDGATNCQNCTSSDESWYSRLFFWQSKAASDKDCPPPTNEIVTCEEGEIWNEHGFCDEEGNEEYFKALDLWFEQWNGWHAAKRLEKLKLDGKAPKDLEVTPPENYTAVTDDEASATTSGSDGVEPIDIRERPCLEGQVRHGLGFCDFQEQIELFDELDRMNLKPKDWSAMKKLKYLQSSRLVPKDPNVNPTESKKKAKREVVMREAGQTTGATAVPVDATATTGSRDEATANDRATGATLDSANATAGGGDKATGATATGPNADKDTGSGSIREESIADDTRKEPCPPGRHRHVKGNRHEVQSPEGHDISLVTADDNTTGATLDIQRATEEATGATGSGSPCGGSTSDDAEEPYPPGRHRHVKGSRHEVQSPEGPGISAKEIRCPGDL